MSVHSRNWTRGRNVSRTCWCTAARGCSRTTTRITRCTWSTQRSDHWSKGNSTWRNGANIAVSSPPTWSRTDGRAHRNRHATRRASRGRTTAVGDRDPRARGEVDRGQQRTLDGRDPGALELLPPSAAGDRHEVQRCQSSSALFSLCPHLSRYVRRVTVGAASSGCNVRDRRSRGDVRCGATRHSTAGGTHCQPVAGRIVPPRLVLAERAGLHSHRIAGAPEYLDPCAIARAPFVASGHSVRDLRRTRGLYTPDDGVHRRWPGDGRPGGSDACGWPQPSRSLAGACWRVYPRRVVHRIAVRSDARRCAELLRQRPVGPGGSVHPGVGPARSVQRPALCAWWRRNDSGWSCTRRGHGRGARRFRVDPSRKPERGACLCVSADRSPGWCVAGTRHDVPAVLFLRRGKRGNRAGARSLRQQRVCDAEVARVSSDSGGADPRHPGAGRFDGVAWPELSISQAGFRGRDALRARVEGAGRRGCLRWYTGRAVPEHPRAGLGNHRIRGADGLSSRSGARTALVDLHLPAISRDRRAGRGGTRVTTLPGAHGVSWHGRWW